MAQVGVFHAIDNKKYAQEWSPYQNNGGTVLGVAGENFAIIAGDTRISTGYSINTRNGSKLAQLTGRCVLASSGMLADRINLQTILKARMVQYKQQHNKEMSTNSVSQMLSNTLYYRRFFPYYTFNVLVGIDKDGKGAVYNYDAIGSFQRVKVSCSGSGHQLIQPLLDNQIERAYQVGKGEWNISKEDALSLIKDAFTSAGERDIYTGDSVDVAIIDNNGITYEKFELKKD